jgi:hypothetical protein
MVVVAISKLLGGHFPPVRHPKFGAESLVGHLVQVVTKGVKPTNFPAHCRRDLLISVQCWCTERMTYLNDNVLHEFEEIGISWDHREALQVTGYAHQYVL